MHNNDDEKALLELVSKGINIPPQPRLLIELRELQTKGKEDVRDLSRIIAKDPGITGTLFRAASSPLFSKGKKLESLNQVLTIIGVKQAYSLVWAAALTTSMSAMATSVSKNKRKALDIFWEHSEQVAQLCAIIAQKRISICKVFQEQAYMTGIFYSCGIPVLMQRIPDYCNALNLHTSLAWPNPEQEDALFESNHRTVGYLVARHWSLPDYACNAIRYHHELAPPGGERDRARALTAILALANHYYDQMKEIPEPHWQAMQKEVLAELQIPGEKDEEDFHLKVIDLFRLH